MHRFGRTWKTLALMAVITLLVSAPPKADAVWHILFNEHFSGDPPDWPWGNWQLNPDRTWFQTGPPYVWGIQDYIFKINGIDGQSVWCVGLPPDLDPEFDDYTNNTESWMRWGPFDLTDAVAARASFWYYNQSQLGADYVRWGGYVGTAWQMYEAGRHSGELTEWHYGYVDFDSLEEGTVSLLGESNVYLLFNFHSNYSETDIGAFIDEVNLAWDDGMFDLEAVSIDFAAPDSSLISQPIVGDTIRFQFDWIAYGSGTTPDFDIACYLDGSLFYTERRNAYIGSSQQIYATTYSDLWVVEPDSHNVVWKIDAGREIEESDEENNVAMLGFGGIPPNTPPWMQFITPVYGDTANTQFVIRWEDEDPDDNATIYLYYDDDSTGYDGQLIPGAYNIMEDDPADSFLWNVAGLPDGDYWVLGLIMDSESTLWYYSDGPLIVDHSWVGFNEALKPPLPADFTLDSVFPNPFNSSTTVRFSLPREEFVQLRVFDSMGRLQEELFSGRLSSGYHEVTWTPKALPSGVYLVEMSTPQIRQRAKALYLK
jgi:hypothetical protein